MRGLALAGAAWLLPAMVLAQTPAPITLDGNRLVLAKPVAFKAGQSALAASEDPAIASVADWLAAKSSITTLRVEGHVAGTAKAQALSEARAMAVARALVKKGVDCKRLIVTGFGDTKPVAAPPNAANTRIEFVNAALRGRLIGAMPADGGGRIAGDVCAGMKAGQ